MVEVEFLHIKNKISEVVECQKKKKVYYTDNLTSAGIRRVNALPQSPKPFVTMSGVMITLINHTVSAKNAPLWIWQYDTKNMPFEVLH